MTVVALAAARPDISADYVGVLNRIDRLYRLLLDAVRNELVSKGIGLTAQQALLLFRVGDQSVKIAELRVRGYYTGTNVSYNVGKLLELELVDYVRSKKDRRSVSLSLTPAGHEIRAIVAALFDRQAEYLASGFPPAEWALTMKLMARFENFLGNPVVVPTRTLCAADKA